MKNVATTLVGLAVIVAIVAIVVVMYSPVRERFEEGDDEEVPPAPETFDPDPSDSDASDASDDDVSDDPSRRRGSRADDDGEDRANDDGQPKATTAGSKYYEGGRELVKMTYDDEDGEDGEDGEYDEDPPEGFDGNRPARVGVVRGKGVAEEDEWWKVMPRPALEQEFDSESLARDFAPFSLGR